METDIIVSHDDMVKIIKYLEKLQEEEECQKMWDIHDLKKRSQNPRPERNEK